MSLPNDVSRCQGIGDEEGIFEDCEKCLRRTSKGGERTPWMEAPKIITFTCEFRIIE